MKKLLPFFTLVLTSPVSFAHHGQDFLVTLDTATPHSGQLFGTSGFDYTKEGSEEESSLLQAFTLGLPGGFSVGATYRIGDDDSGNWSNQSITPVLQWNGTPRELNHYSSLTLGLAFGWEIPTQTNTHDHTHDALPATDCSSLIGIPALYQACQISNQGRQNHRHSDGSHSHQGIHRHNESHGFLRLVADLEIGHHDQLVANLVAVFPDGDHPALGYALAYRHRFNDTFSLGVEVTGDFGAGGEHLFYLTQTLYATESLSLTLGTATGLTPASSDLTVQSILTWRF